MVVSIATRHWSALLTAFDAKENAGCAISAPAYPISVGALPRRYP